jgi:hypothetical protein
MKLYMLIQVLVCLTLFQQLGGKLHPSLLKKLEKLEQFQRNSLKQYRGTILKRSDNNSHAFPIHAISDGGLSIQEEESIIMQYMFTYALDVMDVSIKALPRMIRIGSDTTVGVVSAMMIGFAGVFNLFANSLVTLSLKLGKNNSADVLELHENSAKGDSEQNKLYINPYYFLQNPYEQFAFAPVFSADGISYSDNLYSYALPSPPILNMNPNSNFSANLTPTVIPSALPKFFLYKMNKSLMKTQLANGLNHSARLFFAVSQGLAISGHITESVTIGLGEAIEDSFQHLHFLSYLGQQMVDYLLINDEIDTSYEKAKQQNLTRMKILEKQEKLAKSIEKMPDFVIYGAEQSSEQQNDEEEDSPTTKRKTATRNIYIKPKPKVPFDAWKKDNLLISDGKEKRQQRKPKAKPTHTMSVLEKLIAACQEEVEHFFDYEKELYASTKDSIQFYLNFIHSNSFYYVRKTYLGIWDVILYSFEIPSITIHITLSFLFILIAFALPFPNKKMQFYFILMIMVVFWFILVSMEFIQRYRLIERIKMETMQSYLNENIPQPYQNVSYLNDLEFMHFENKPNEEFQTVLPSSSSRSSHSATASPNSYPPPTAAPSLSDEYFHLLNQLPSSSSSSTPPSSSALFEMEQIIASQKMIWFNTFNSLLWNIIDDDFYNSGVGLYMSEVYEEMLLAELEQIHETTQGLIRGIKLKKFHFGTNPPLMKSIHTNLLRNQTCLKELMTTYAHEQSMKKSSSQQSKKNSFPSFFYSSSSSKDPSSHHKKEKNGFIKKLRNYFQRSPTSSSLNRFLTDEQEDYLSNFSDQFTSFLFEKIIAPASSLFPDSSDSSSSSSDDPKVNAFVKKFTKYSNFFISCDQLILDINLLYVSKDLDIVFSLRTNEIKSVLPEFTIGLSELLFDGWIRFKIQLTNDYPFFGNATVRESSFFFSLFYFFSLFSIDVIYSASETRLHHQWIRWTGYFQHPLCFPVSEFLSLFYFRRIYGTTFYGIGSATYFLPHL